MTINDSREEHKPSLKVLQLLFVGFYKHQCYMLYLVYTVGYKGKCLVGSGRN